MNKTYPIAPEFSANNIQQLEAMDDACLWHPFTPQSVYRQEQPIMFVAGKGNCLIDIHGKKYIDGVGSIWCNLLGHGKDEINQAISTQLGQLAHSTLLGHTHPLAIELAHKLVEISPDGLTRVFFSDNGSTAVEVAIKMAYQYWQQLDESVHQQRKKFISFDSAYHGDTLGSVSTGHIDLFHACYRDLLFETIKAPLPHVYRSPYGNTPESVSAGCLQVLERLFGEYEDTVAAMVIEPGFQGAGGILVQPKGFLKQASKLAKDSGALVIFDEVASGLGRSGKMFSCMQEEITPDFLCLAKGITGGYLPLAATLTTQSVFDAFLGPPEKALTFFHGHTYTGNQLGAAAALATLDVFERENILEQVNAKIAVLKNGLKRFWNLPGVGDVRQYGLAAGIELVADKSTKQSYPAKERRGMRVCMAAREHGVFLRPLGDVIVIMPPLTISEDELTTIFDAIEAGLIAICSNSKTSGAT